MIFTCIIDSEDVPVRIGKSLRRHLRVSEENYERADFSIPTFVLRYNFQWISLWVLLFRRYCWWNTNIFLMFLLCEKNNSFVIFSRKSLFEVLTIWCQGVIYIYSKKLFHICQPWQFLGTITLFRALWSMLRLQFYFTYWSW